MQEQRTPIAGTVWPGHRAPARLILALCSLASIGALPTRADSPPVAGPAQIAQATTAASGPALNVTELRDCLCMEQQMSADRDDLAMRQDLLNERQQELSNLDQQVMEQRSNLSPQDTVGQQVLKDLMSQQQTLRTTVQNDLRPAYNTKVDEWNALVARYNTQCADRPRYTMDVKTAQQNLQCPKP
ncbi:MAG TPA: hypothetical protein VM659_03455 [Dongiaceae bacterium]|nr:hypothetical protein [Dongiaceae bacterium]